ncbi:MAG: hypothetical protein AAF950_10875 [Pseudomonadota bacterium]
MTKTSTFKLAGVTAVAAIALAACVSATPYQPSKGGINNYGYGQTKIESGKYRVTFRGNSSTDLATVENYILLRAAELAVADGYGHFTILDDSESGRRSFNSTTTGFGGGFGGFGGFGAFGFNNGFGGAGTASTRTRERKSFDVAALVQAFEGTKDAEDVMAFNAQEVIENLGPIAVRPG